MSCMEIGGKCGCVVQSIELVTKDTLLYSYAGNCGRVVLPFHRIVRNVFQHVSRYNVKLVYMFLYFISILHV